MKQNLGKSGSCLVSKYIDTDFDHVVNVSENMDAVVTVEGMNQEIKEVLPHVDNIKKVADGINEVKDVSNNMNVVADVHNNMDAVQVTSGNINTITQVGDKLPEIQEVADNLDSIDKCIALEPKLDKVIDNEANIRQVSDEIDAVVNVHGNMGDILQVAAMKDEIDTVSSISNEVAAVGRSIDDIQVVSDDIESVNILADGFDHITKVSPFIDDVVTTGSNIQDVVTVSQNLNHILNLSSDIYNVTDTKYAQMLRDQGYSVIGASISNPILGSITDMIVHDGKVLSYAGNFPHQVSSSNFNPNDYKEHLINDLIKRNVLSDVFGSKLVDLVAGLVITPTNNKYPILTAFGAIYELADNSVSYTVKSFAQNAESNCEIILADDTSIIAYKMTSASKDWSENNFKKVFDSIAELKKANLKLGQTVKTKGYYEKNDGGSASYIIKLKNDVLIGYANHSLDNGLMAELEEIENICLHKFGIKTEKTFDAIPRINEFFSWADKYPKHTIRHNFDKDCYIGSTLLINGDKTPDIHWSATIRPCEGADMEIGINYIKGHVFNQTGHLNIIGTVEGDPRNYSLRKITHGIVHSGTLCATMPATINVTGVRGWANVTAARTPNNPNSNAGFGINYTNIYAWFCGTRRGIENAALNYTSFVNSGSHNVQQSVVTVDSIPYLLSNGRFPSELNSLVYAVINKEPYSVIGVDEVAKTITLRGWVKAEQSGEFNFISGGAFLHTGNNSAGVTVSGIIDCAVSGISLAVRALYSGSFNVVQSQSNGICLAHTMNEDAQSGGCISMIYSEGDACSAFLQGSNYFTNFTIGNTSQWHQETVHKRGAYSYRQGTASNPEEWRFIPFSTYNITHDGVNYSQYIGQQTTAGLTNRAERRTFGDMDIPTKFDPQSVDAMFGSRGLDRIGHKQIIFAQIPRSLRVVLPTVESGITFRNKNKNDGQYYVFSGDELIKILGLNVSTDGVICVFSFVMHSTIWAESGTDVDIQFIPLNRCMEGTIK